MLREYLLFFSDFVVYEAVVLVQAEMSFYCVGNVFFFNIADSLFTCASAILFIY